MPTSLYATQSTRSGPHPTKLGVAVLMALLALAAAGCGSSGSSHTTTTAPRLFTASQLTTRILPAPDGYQVDPTPDASGAITPALFDQFGGVRSPSTLGFVTGFKQNYVNPSTGEGLIVTVLEFKSAGDASTYFTQTRPSTLSYAGATIKPFPTVPGAFEADGTKAYNDGYYHAIVDAINNFYFQVAYATPQPAPAPTELGPWAGLEYTVLRAS
jgi:hypothetical protein